jgi:hypothetical protein
MCNRKKAWSGDKIIITDGPSEWQDILEGARKKNERFGNDRLKPGFLRQDLGLGIPRRENRVQSRMKRDAKSRFRNG